MSDWLPLPGPSVEAYCLHCQHVLFRLPQSHPLHRAIDVCVCEWKCCLHAIKPRHPIHIQYRPSSVSVSEFVRVLPSMTQG